ncbi:hypothetical protein OG760_21055 [Streptomyces sp. NBC_00963]|uniref:hypothetical protein n=1 Tax=Streptomyces sp. NBC_00963 TaxID=2903697 RepID=UPI003870D3BD|nr:hypothetical protein OG760_21055 [Streptomyces sp. NBC_00963]
MYLEKSPKTWSAICVALYVAGIVYLGLDTIPDEIGLWLGLSALFLLLLLPCLAVPISKAIYQRIRLEGETLRVGRERIPLSEVDPASVQAALQGAIPTPADRYATSMAAIDAPVPGLRAAERSGPRLVGGGWAVPMGMDSVTISTRQGESLLIATRNRTAFLTALANGTAGISNS